MRELLRTLYDRLGEVSVGYRGSDPEFEVQGLRAQIGNVLAKGYFDGAYTDVDMRQMPRVLW